MDSWNSNSVKQNVLTMVNDHFMVALFWYCTYYKLLHIFDGTFLFQISPVRTTGGRIVQLSWTNRTASPTCCRKATGIRRRSEVWPRNLPPLQKIKTDWVARCVRSKSRMWCPDFNIMVFWLPYSNHHRIYRGLSLPWQRIQVACRPNPPPQLP